VEDLASDFDTAWKEALEWFFEPFLAFFFPTVHGGIDWTRGTEFLDKELQQLVPEAQTGRGTVDKLARVWTLTGAEARVFIHVEVQSNYDAGFAERMYVYNYRLRDKHDRMPVSVAVLGDESATWRPDNYQAGRWGCEVRFTFPMVKLVDYKGRETELEVDANPFAVVTLAHLKAHETKGDFTSRYNWKMRMMKGLYDRGFDRVRMVRLFRVIDWVIKLPKVQCVALAREMDRFEQEKQMERPSPTQEIWQEDGIAIGLRKAIEKALKRRGAEASDLMPRVNAIEELADLEAFLDAVLAQSDLEALRAMLPPQPQA
jgi:hypothetical protein